MLVYDRELENVSEAIAASAGPALQRVRAGGDDEYEALLAAATPYSAPLADERSVLSINYTSGTTGSPKGVMYHHRGAYLQALAMALHMRLEASSVFLWTLPMFHCNGWCFTWAVTAAGATHVCERKVEPDRVWRYLERFGVTHFNAAPTVLVMLAWHEAAPVAGDLAVMHPDGYIEIRDRSKDIIVSGGENIASTEVERVLANHPAVIEAAVVAGPDPLWGEVPVAFVTLRHGVVVSEQHLIDHARAALAHFKAPKRVIFGELPRNATGTIQKFVLRERAKQIEAAPK